MAAQAEDFPIAVNGIAEHLEKHIPLGGGKNLSGAALKEGEADLLFQITDIPAAGLLAQEQVFCRLCEVLRPIYLTKYVNFHFFWHDNSLYHNKTCFNRTAFLIWLQSFIATKEREYSGGFT